MNINHNLVIKNHNIFNKEINSFNDYKKICNVNVSINFIVIYINVDKHLKPFALMFNTLVKDIDDNFKFTDVTNMSLIVNDKKSIFPNIKKQ